MTNSAIKKILFDLAHVVIEHAERNPEFKDELLRVLGQDRLSTRASPLATETLNKRPRNRRAPAVLNPIEIVREGEPLLRTRLAALNLEQLRDIVAEHGLDPGKLVMKWRTPERVIDRIVEVSIARSRHGDAFR